MPKEHIDDELWLPIKPLLSTRTPRNCRYAGRNPTPDRAALTGTVFVPRAGKTRNILSQETSCGSGLACRR